MVAWPRLRRSPWTGCRLLLVGLVVAAFLSACFGGTQRPERPERSALWLEAGTAAALEATDLARLAQAGVGEVFVERARIEWSGGLPRLESLELPALPARTPVTLVIRGSWARGGEAEVLDALAGEVERVLIETEGRGWSLQGFHLDLDEGVEGRVAERDLEAYAAALERIREELPEGWLLSTTFDPAWLEREEAPAVAAAADFLVPFLYGRRPEDLPEDLASGEDPWRLARVEVIAARLEALGRPYLVGVVTLGAAEFFGTGGQPRGSSLRFALEPLALHPALQLVPGFSLEGCDCRRYTFKARSPVRLEEAGEGAGAELAMGESVEITALAGSDLREYRRRLEGWREAGRLEHYRGDVFFRLPVPEEKLSLSAEGLLAALAPPAQVLEVAVSSQGAQTLAFEMTNPGPESTELAFIDGNYLEITAGGATFASVEPGDFTRYQLLRSERGSLVPDFRRATVLRLFRPVLAAGGTVASGPVRLSRSGGELRLRLESHFLLPSGEVLESSVGQWPPE